MDELEQVRQKCLYFIQTFVRLYKKELQTIMDDIDNVRMRELRGSNTAKLLSCATFPLTAIIGYCGGSGRVASMYKIHLSILSIRDDIPKFIIHCTQGLQHIH